MKIIGIIAEYNPFHNGHAYQIEKIRKRTGADYIVVAMSGDFVQRGAPAIIDKYARTKMALSCGADLIIELPVLWATASAEYFALAGVTLFEKMGCVDGICFGAETDDLPLLTAIADLLAEEPENYRRVLSACLKEGMNFPMSRTRAVCDYLTAKPHHTSFSSGNYHARTDGPQDTHTDQALDTAMVASILNEPNNILAIEYLKALKRRHASITPFLLKREGAGYHDVNIHAVSATPTASATAIRGILTECFLPPCGSASERKRNCRCTASSRLDAAAGTSFTAAGTGSASAGTSLTGSDTLSARLATAMPAPALAVLTDYLEKYPPVCANDFSSVLGYRLLSGTPEMLADTGDCNADIANRFYRNRYAFCSFESFCEQTKSKDITYTRISRILLHLILGISNQDYARGKSLDYLPYLRVLGFRKDSAPLLSRLKETSAVPILSKLADASGLLTKDAYALLEKDIFASELYGQIRMIQSAEFFSGTKHSNTTSSGYGGEFRQPIIIV